MKPEPKFNFHLTNDQLEVIVAVFGNYVSTACLLQIILGLYGKDQNTKTIVFWAIILAFTFLSLVVFALEYFQLLQQLDLIPEKVFPRIPFFMIAMLAFPFAITYINVRLYIGCIIIYLIIYCTAGIVLFRRVKTEHRDQLH